MLSFRHRNPLPFLLTTLAPLLLLPSCLQGAQLDNEPEIKQALGCDMVALFKKCDGSGCHEGGNGFPPSGGTDFYGPGTPTSLVGAPAVYPEAVANYYGDGYGYCPEERELIIDPINPDNSLFLKKLNDTQTCGWLMPDSGKLPEADIACFRQWVLDTIAEASASGGATGTGGAVGAGGAVGTGGAVGAGGAVGTGGAATESGGAASTGGSPSASGGDQAQF